MHATCTAEGHRQAPPLLVPNSSEVPVLPEVVRPVCHSLLARLLRLTFDSDEDAFRVVAEYVQPLPLLLSTVREAMCHISDPGQQEHLANVVLCVEDGCIFEHHQGPSPVAARPVFQPDLCAFPARVARPTELVLCNCAPCETWLAFLGAPVTLRPFQMGSLTQAALAEATALFAVFDDAPLAASPIWDAPAASLCLLRKHASWCLQLLQHVELAIKLAYSGRAVFLGFRGVSFQALGFLSSWLVECGAIANRQTPEAFGLFHLEFSCQRRVRSGLKPS